MVNPLLSPYYETVKWILLIEFVIVFCLAIYGLFLRKVYSYIWQRKKRIQSNLKNKLIESISMQEGDVHISSHYLKARYLVPVIDTLDQEIKSANWQKLKKTLFYKKLFPEARHLSHAKRWTKRILAARCFLLFSDPENEPYILKLLQDRTPIIQYAAAFSAAKLGTEKSTNAIIDVMKQSDHFLRHPFRSAFSNGSPTSFLHIEKRLESEEDLRVRNCCLEILSKHMDAGAANLAKKDLQHPDKELKLAAIRALGHYQDPGSIGALLPLLKDPEWEVRAIAARALGYLGAEQALFELTNLLKDRIWWVRMNAALALKRLGEIGRKQLEIQRAEEDQYAYDIAQYVLPLDLSQEAERT